MHLLVNGEPYEAQATTVAELLKELKLKEARVVVEKNGAIIKRPDLATTQLSAEDRLEIVQFVGGG
ncbi:MAG: sulfur carrier protein ThiS [Desulfovibrio sp.]|nr:sulfur carrier protein ThiS [Desulfovibrio sp.]